MCKKHFKDWVARGAAETRGRTPAQTPRGTASRKRARCAPGEVWRLGKEAEEAPRAQRQSAVSTHPDTTLEELEEKDGEFNEEDERDVEMHRQQRLAEWQWTRLKNKWRSSGNLRKGLRSRGSQSWRGLVGNLAPLEQGLPLGALIHQHVGGLARKVLTPDSWKPLRQPAQPRHYPERVCPQYLFARKAVSRPRVLDSGVWWHEPANRRVGVETVGVWSNQPDLGGQPKRRGGSSEGAEAALTRCPSLMWQHRSFLKRQQ